MSQEIVNHETLTVESHDILSPAVLAEWQTFVQIAAHHRIKMLGSATWHKLKAVRSST